MDDAALEALLFVKEASPIHARALPDWNYVHRELRRPGVTLMQPERDVAPALELPVHWLWGAESPCRTSYDQRPSMLLCILHACLPAPYDLALTPSRRQGRTTDTGGPRLHPDAWLSRHRRTWPF